MKYTIKLVFVFTFLMISQMTFGQRWFKSSALEFGIIGGTSHYTGDLTQSFFETKGLKPSFGLITRYTPFDRFTFRLSGQWGGIAGDDNWYPDQKDVVARNLSFQSVLWDFTAAAEWNLRTLNFRSNSGMIPYIFGGISVFKFNPTAQFNYDPSSPLLTAIYGSNYASLKSRDGDWVELQPLSTEGQETTEFNERKRYHLTQIGIPVGAGIKYQINYKWVLGLEYGLRITFTDYLDDVSSTYVESARLEAAYGPMSAAMGDRSSALHLEGDTRGDQSNNDMYGILGITLTYRIMGNKDQCATF